MYINQWNEVIASALRCNHDVSFIAAVGGFMGLLYYITDYATKLSKPLYHNFLLAASLAPTIPEDRREQETGYKETDFRKAQQFLTRVYNKTLIS